MRSITGAKWNASLNYGAADGTNASYPVTRTYDGYTDLTTKGTATTDRYFNIYWSGGTSFDTICLVNCNAVTVGCTYCAVRIADSADFATNMAVVADWVPATTRHAFLDLDHSSTVPQQYSNVPYLSIGFSAAGITGPIELGEVFVGCRKQLKTNPFDPWDPQQWRNQEAITQSAGGVTTKYVYYGGQRILKASIGPHETNRINDIVNFYKTDTSFGTHPFVWMDKPTSDPDGFNMMVFDQDEWTSPYDGPWQRRFQFSAVEQGPHYESLE